MRYRECNLQRKRRLARSKAVRKHGVIVAMKPERPKPPKKPSTDR